MKKKFKVGDTVTRINTRVGQNASHWKIGYSFVIAFVEKDHVIEKNSIRRHINSEIATK